LRWARPFPRTGCALRAEDNLENLGWEVNRAEGFAVAWWGEWERVGKFGRSHLKNRMLGIVALVTLCAGALAAQSATDTTSHTVQFVTVDRDVKLEVLDWGGTGRPLIFLAGMGNTAHNFDAFAPKFTDHYHVYGITRRGFGASSKPAPASGNYTADHLGDDVLAVIDALKLGRPVLVGHSFAGEEMSSIGSRYPEKVAGLIYLDAAYGFAFYDPAHPAMEIEMNDVKRRIDQIEAGGVDEKKSLLELEASVSRFEETLRKANVDLASMPPIPPRPPIQAALNFGGQKYTQIPVPILAIFACPHDWSQAFRDDPELKAKRMAADRAWCNGQADAFAAGVPSAHVVRIPNADHYVFHSNEAEVVREMNAFLAKLP
jgi:non-heme chloroperoxidase